jgi:endonuclease YncB( thermonuclease family)
MKKSALACWALACIFTLSAPSPFVAAAQEMPAPRRMPRTPVSRQVLEVQHEPAPAARVLQGPAMIFDGEKLRIGETDLRLFGVVPPQLAASFGPQARATLDQQANGQSVTCQIRDRDRDGRLLATCRSSSGNDMALELLKRGLAVTARGSITGTDLATPYLSAEQAAQTQKIGLWSMAPPPAAIAAPAIVATAPPAPPIAHVETPALPPIVVKEDKAPPHIDKTPIAVATAPTDMQAKIAADVVDQRAQARIDDDNWEQDPEVGFFERYQLLIAGMLMLTTALSIIGALWAQKTRDKRDETKAVAAALRGELMAARGICVGRAKTITNEEEDHASIWPRIRGTLYQAYVGRLGLLGAELARQVASIYGQSSDYAALYNPNGAAYDASKKTALETLARHIDEVLPKLANIEQTGATPAALAYQRPRSHYDESTMPLLRTTSPHVLQAPYKTIGPARSFTPFVPEKKISQQPQPESTTLSEPAQSAVPEPTTYETPAPVYETAAAIYEKERAASAAADAAALAAVPPLKTVQSVSPEPVAKHENGIKPAVLWEIVRGFIQNHRNAIMQANPHDDHVNEYAAMIEADMARYPYNAEGRESFDLPTVKKNH